MGRLLLAHIVILQGIGLAAVAYAGTDRGRSGAGLTRLESHYSEEVKVRGTLKCPLPQENNGRACTLSFEDQTTGASLRVIGSDTAMQLFQEGYTEVTARGFIQGDALRVDTISAVAATE